MKELGSLASQYRETLLTRPWITQKIAPLKISFLVPAWVMIICGEYLEPLVIKSRTAELGVYDKLNFIVFFSHEKKSSQILARK